MIDRANKTWLQPPWYAVCILALKARWESFSSRFGKARKFVKFTDSDGLTYVIPAIKR